MQLPRDAPAHGLVRLRARGADLAQAASAPAQVRHRGLERPLLPPDRVAARAHHPGEERVHQGRRGDDDRPRRRPGTAELGLQQVGALVELRDGDDAVGRQLPDRDVRLDQLVREGPLEVVLLLVQRAAGRDDRPGQGALQAVRRGPRADQMRIGRMDDRAVRAPDLDRDDAARGGRLRQRVAQGPALLVAERPGRRQRLHVRTHEGLDVEGRVRRDTPDDARLDLPRDPGAQQGRTRDEDRGAREREARGERQPSEAPGHTRSTRGRMAVGQGRSAHPHPPCGGRHGPSGPGRRSS